MLSPNGTNIKTPLGTLIINSNADGLCEVDFKSIAKQSATSKNQILKKSEKQLNEYFQRKRKKFDLPLSLNGTVFQQKVWQVIAAIPYGKTITYSELAKAAGKPKAIRAAATACGKNPIPIIIPCHRVVGKSGLGGYSGGLDIKIKLLQLEGILTHQ